MSDPVRAYALSDEHYYDRLERGVEPGAFLERLGERLAGRADTIDGTGIWARCLDRPLAELPAHGWKLHVSARPAQLREVVEAVIDEYLVEPFSFKCVRGPEVGLFQLARWWPRGGAAKAVTVYPLSLEHARAVADRLTARLAGYEGAHVLTDRRYPGSGVVQYRYGSFRRPPGVDDLGRGLSSITGPDGTSWDDDRSPTFALPPWVAEDPFAPRADATGADATAADATGADAATAAADDGDPTGLLHRYRVTSVLRHSTAGGVYLATGEDGVEYVLKEARPHTAFAPDGSDAVDRLHREHETLVRLAGTGVAPTAVEIVRVWEHTFLVQTKVPGATLQRWLSRHLPFATGIASDDYEARATAIVAQLRAALATCLDHGVVYHDTSLTNVLVDDDDVARLVDFEGCRPVGADPELYQRTAGHAPEPGTPAWASDAAYLSYAADAVEAAMIMPRNALLAFRPEVHARLLTVSARHLGRPIGDLVTRLQGTPPTAAELETDTSDAVAGIVRGLLDAATPERRDRLFPGDKEQFATNALGIAHGAAGVLRVLRRLDGPVAPELSGWLEARVGSGLPLPPGLYVGRAGIGLTLRELGLDDRGLLDGAAAEVLRGTHPAGLYAGLAGVGLGLLTAHRHLPDPTLVERAAAIADRLLDVADDDGTGLWWRVRPAHPLGLMHGSSGVAVFLAELAVETDDPGTMRMARRALAFDVARGRVRPNGGIGFGSVVDGFAFEPYVGRGGSGVGMAVAHLAALTDDPDLRRTLHEVVVGTGMPYAHNPGYLTGMSGLAEFLLDARELLPGETAIGHLTLDESLERIVEQIWAMRCLDDGPDGIRVGFPGDSLVRQSCDLATGSAGVALTLHRARVGGPALDVRYGRPLQSEEVASGAR